jgi:hypothetical protein
MGIVRVVAYSDLPRYPINMLETSKKMITVKAYLYPNTAEIQVFDPLIFTTRNRQVYSRAIKVYQGINNPIQVIVRNQDQKTVNLSDEFGEPAYTVVASIQDPTNQVKIQDYVVTWSNVAQGKGNFTITQGILDTLEQRFYKLTFRTIVISDSTDKPLYIDDNYGVPLDLQVLPAYYGFGGGDGGDGGGDIGGGDGDDGGGYIPDDGSGGFL